MLRCAHYRCGAVSRSALDAGIRDPYAHLRTHVVSRTLEGAAEPLGNGVVVLHYRR
ncbi:hypothetical protein ACFFX1_07195 [Dactylosporangium sucinum]|uniref:Uncharacterized protein n=1 Tax=Dactylosporangium sucinum TaxID=1424081 RepID=A0A917UBW8_9ACTN|nr:hypothetical protein [Dactylosporangium sucinum]GGM70383.1 hypothetical protein GCM10007977_085230 [Dactylosporangium sucinum]